MNIKSLFLVGALALSSLSIANAKDYHFTLDNSAKAGNVVLKAGEYKVKLEGADAVFTDVRTNQTFTTPVKVDNAGKKHDMTAVETNVQNGTERIRAIELGGSTETLEFGD